MDAMIIIRRALLVLLVASVLHGVPNVAEATAATAGRRVYIVFTERQTPLQAAESSDVSAKIETFHHGLISDALLDGSSARDRVVYHYTRSLNGFAARLTEDEKNNLAGKDGVLSIHERVMYRPQTTRSWDFLGLPLHEHRSLPFEQDVIIGMIDTGITPGKIIGAWAYDGGLPDGQVFPIDDEGHGTHIASTAAGRVVRNASLYGLANGTARGAVPGARLAIYKVCLYNTGCASEDILAAMDDAIADGVDVISASLSAHTAREYPDDALAIGAFHAVRRGVLTSVPAGNCGPKLGTVSNVAPWMISTAGTTTDRRIVSKLVLGNRKNILGHSINTFPDIIGKQALLVDPGNCVENLEGAWYKGAILLCPPGQLIDQRFIIRSGATGIILPDRSDDEEDYPSFTLPVVLVGQAQFQEILRYYNGSSVESKNVMITSSSPENLYSRTLAHPESTSWPPGHLSARHPQAWTMSGQSLTISSGTSIASPHVTGAAAYVKSVHPHWSPAATISSLVTTAKPIHSNVREAEFAYGAGQVNPIRAADPGLVYDASEADYINLLCAQGYNASQLASITGTRTICPTTGPMVHLNYPSIAVPVINYGVEFTVEIPRKVTNVGPANSVYHARIRSAEGITVSVEPDELVFTAEREELSFKVSVTGSLQMPAANGSSLGASASIIWSDGKHEVRSPIYVFPRQFRSYVEPVHCRCRPGKCDSQLD
ncbi:hypothetical protein PR202_gb12678 [Eleusine coracana subsp. coracana]|uniref:Uncharacterized protein n=1 Tax=Eleusine coracana subsp. coracana TaxID=191504 RepID=A0AAV5EPZ2_ELECO|nr:hypothetical protein PR202_gb12678 [Eleusine coracana subsp. coracana]